MCLRAQLCLTLSDPLGCSPPGSVHGTSQAGILEWVAISFSRGSSWPRDGTWISHVSCIGRWIIYHRATWEALNIYIYVHIHIHTYVWENEKTAHTGRKYLIIYMYVEYNIYIYRKVHKLCTIFTVISTLLKELKCSLWLSPGLLQVHLPVWGSGNPRSGITGSYINSHGIWFHCFMADRRGKSGNNDKFYFLGLQNHCRRWLQPEH